MGRRSKQKGSQFERDICRALSLWVSGGENKNLFWRSSQSGGRATTLRKRGENLSIQAGDIAAIDPAGHRFCNTFFVECKAYKTVRWDLLLYDATKFVGVLGRLWRVCKKQAADHRKVPVMIVRENGKPTMVCLPSSLAARLDLPPCVDFLCCGMCVYFMDELLESVCSDAFILGGESENSSHGGLASHKQAKRRLSLDVSTHVATESGFSESGDCG